MVEIANAEDCGLFAITGDLFENNSSISKKDVKAVLKLLSHFCGTVVILPGNHDYYDKDAKVWQYVKDAMASYDNIMLLTEYRPYEIHICGEDVILYPALCTSLHSSPGQNNLGWIKKAVIDNDVAYHIGIAHGAVEGETIDNEGQYFLMKRSELENIPMDVWLIGHTHVLYQMGGYLLNSRITINWIYRFTARTICWTMKNCRKVQKKPSRLPFVLLFSTISFPQAAA